MDIRELAMLLLLLALIALFFLLRKKGDEKERRRLKEEREQRDRKRKEGFAALSEEERRMLYLNAMKERTAFVLNAQEDYDTSFHSFPSFCYEAKNNISESLISDSLGYFVIPAGVERIAAFFFTGDLDYEDISAMTININGMVFRRFEGFSEYMCPHYYDVKSGDIITIEIEFNAKKDFSIKDFGILLLARKERK